jgi:hypothetical protein
MCLHSPVNLRIIAFHFWIHVYIGWIMIMKQYLLRVKKYSGLNTKGMPDIHRQLTVTPNVNDIME